MIANDSVKTRLTNILIQKKDTIVQLKLDRLKASNLLEKEQNKVDNYKKYGKWGLLVSFFNCPNFNSSDLC